MVPGIIVPHRVPFEENNFQGSPRGPPPGSRCEQKTCAVNGERDTGQLVDVLVVSVAELFAPPVNVVKCTQVGRWVLGWVGFHWWRLFTRLRCEKSPKLTVTDIQL